MIPFIQEIGNYYGVFIHEIRHRLKWTKQEIYLDVYCRSKFYEKCEKVKEEYERH